MDMTEAVQNAKTSGDHEALAKHYEDVAKEMQTKADEHKASIVDYRARLYSKQARRLASHCQYLVRAYEEAVAENIRMAESHRQLAAGAD